MTSPIQVHPLNATGLRRLTVCPPYFSPVDFDCAVKPKIILDWIWINLTGRFYMSDHYRTKETKLEIVTRVAFEIPSEASYFALCVSEINKF